MELEFVWKATRRYWAVVAVCGLLGVAAAVLLAPSVAVRYQSTALVLILSGEGGSAGDRYVASELVILQSPPIAERAAELAGVSMSPAAIAENVTFAQIPGTDVVRIIAASPSPTEAQAIANGYVDAYLDARSALGSADQNIDEGLLNQRVTALEDQLDDVEQRVQEAMAPFVRAAEELADGGTPSVPAVQDVAPALAVEREVLIDQYRTVLSQLAGLQSGEPEQATTDRQVIQRAELPSQSLATSSSTLRLAIPIGGLLLGVALATALARSSRYVLDTDEIERTLEAPIVAVVPERRSLRSGSLDHLAQLPTDVRGSINRLCVQVESAGASAPGWSVVVTGTRRDIGTTTVAAAMAHRFSELGSRVLLIDFDTEDPAVSARFDVEEGGLAALADVSRQDRLVPPTPSGFPMLSVIGGGSASARWRPSRQELRAALTSASLYADIVVVDAGPTLASSSAAVLAQSADAVVLTVPARRQPRETLELVARQLDLADRHLFPVIVPAPKKQGRQRKTSRQRGTSSSPDPSQSGLANDQSERSEREVGPRA